MAKKEVAKNETAKKEAVKKETAKVAKKGQADMKEAVTKSEAFFEKYKKQLLAALAAVIIIVGGWMLYKEFVVKPRLEKANTALAKPQELFGMRQFDKALKGDSTGVKGFIAIADEYSNTPAGNLANLYAGLCYANLATADSTAEASKKWQEAIRYLDQFDQKGDLMVSPMALVAAGDAYANVNDLDKAVSLFKKAAETADKATEDGVNNSVSPTALLKASIVLLKQNKKDEALQLLKDIKAKYVQTPLRSEIDKYIEYASK